MGVGDINQQEIKFAPADPTSANFVADSMQSTQDTMQSQHESDVMLSVGDEAEEDDLLHVGGQVQAMDADFHGGEGESEEDSEILIN